MAGSSSRLEKAGHVAFIVMCAAITGAAIQYVAAARNPSPATVARAPVARGTRVAVPEELKGTAQLLLVLSTTCQYCTQSMPFYTKLANLPQVAAGRLRLTVVSLQSDEQMKGYLESNGLRLDRIVSLRDSGVSVTGTPVLVLVSPDGIVRDSWGGWLPPAQEAMVLDTISQLIPS